MHHMKPQSTFTEGFGVGYRTVRGPEVALPELRSEPDTPYGWTPYLYGVRVGLKRAGVHVPA